MRNHYTTKGLRFSFSFNFTLRETKDVEEKMNYEINYIRNAHNRLTGGLPQENLGFDFDLNKLSSEKFEAMCVNLLMAQGFSDVHQRGSTNTPDDGVDIEAVENMRGLFGSETRKWIFQCKCSKKQISRKDILEISELLEEFEADRFGIFSSNLFTPRALDRIKKLHRDSVTIFDANEIKYKLSKYPDIIKKYFY